MAGLYGADFTLSSGRVYHYPAPLQNFSGLYQKDRFIIYATGIHHSRLTFQLKCRAGKFAVQHTAIRTARRYFQYNPFFESFLHNYSHDKILFSPCSSLRYFSSIAIPVRTSILRYAASSDSGAPQIQDQSPKHDG